MMIKDLEDMPTEGAYDVTQREWKAGKQLEM